MRLVEREVLPLFEGGGLTVPVAASSPSPRPSRRTSASRRGKLGKVVLLP